MYKVFSVSDEVIVEEERPKLASIMGSQGTSTGNLLNHFNFISLVEWVRQILNIRQKYVGRYG